MRRKKCLMKSIKSTFFGAAACKGLLIFFNNMKLMFAFEIHKKMVFSYVPSSYIPTQLTSTTKNSIKIGYPNRIYRPILVEICQLLLKCIQIFVGNSMIYVTTFSLKRTNETITFRMAKTV